jgi:hypothetical protein
MRLLWSSKELVQPDVRPKISWWASPSRSADRKYAPMLHGDGRSQIVPEKATQPGSRAQTGSGGV